MPAREYKNSVEITATDLAGNVTKSRLTVMAYERTFKSDSLELSDNFLMSVQNKLQHLAPQVANPLDCYLYINNNVRAANAQTLREIGKNTAAAMLWSGAFARLPRSAAGRALPTTDFTITRASWWANPTTWALTWLLSATPRCRRPTAGA